MESVINTMIKHPIKTIILVSAISGAVTGIVESAYKLIEYKREVGKEK